MQASYVGSKSKINLLRALCSYRPVLAVLVSVALLDSKRTSGRSSVSDLFAFQV